MFLQEKLSRPVSFFKIYFIFNDLYWLGGGAFMHIRVQVPEEARRGSNPLLDLQVIVSHPMGESTGQQIWGLSKSSIHLLLLLF